MRYCLCGKRLRVRAAIVFEGRKILVTGADGFIGSHLVEALVAKKAHVTALALYNSFDSQGWLDDLEPVVRQALTIIRGDIRDASFLRRIVAGQEIVFNLAALIAIPQSYAIAQSYIETNLIGLLNILEAARETNIQRIIHTSTSEVYGTAISMPIREDHPLQGQSPYSASKIGADMMAQAFALSFDVPVIILRPFNTFGPRQSERAILPTIIRQALDDKCSAICVGDVDITRDMTFVSDTVAAFLAAASSAAINFGEPYNAGSGEPVQVSDLLRMVIEMVGTNKPVVQDASRLRPQHSEVRALLAESSKLNAITGWHRSVSLQDGIQITIEWWRKRLASGLVRTETSYIT